MKKILFLGLFMSFTLCLFSQDALVRGYVFDKDGGAAIEGATIVLLGNGNPLGAYSDEKGFYNILDVPPGRYELRGTRPGFDTFSVSLVLTNGLVKSQQVLLAKSSKRIKKQTVNAQKQKNESEIGISKIEIKKEDLQKIPTIGGEADLAQFLQIVPGVVTTGDQGGQLYIRGGAPVHNKLLLDGLTIYNAFHSIGLFSVYETEIIDDIDIITGGFNAEYGGRISAIVDVETKDGNKTKHGGMVSMSPFLSKAIIEGPLKKLGDDGSSISYILTAKHSYLNESSKVFYNYLENNPLGTDKIIPYNFTDVFGKVSINSGSGSKISFTGFKYTDKVDLAPVSVFDWDASGFGTHYSLFLGKTLVDGHLVYSNYKINLQEADEKPRTSAVGGFNVGVNFKFLLPKNSDIKYGFDVNGFSTIFEFFNKLGSRIDQNQYTTEVGAYLKYRKKFDKLVIEPGFRVQYYASLFNFSPEPRLGMKYVVNDKVRVKLATGLYSQNLISTKSDFDVVNLFTGFLSGPEQKLKRIDGTVSNHKLQKSFHFITGVELDLFEGVQFNIEPYYKGFSQIININRNKVFTYDPDYQIEVGNAYGIDLLLKYEDDRVYTWISYSLGKINRDNGEQVYPPHYDRRHNLNIVTSYLFGKKLKSRERPWEASVRWNLGSGFPFTKTQGFFEGVDFSQGVGTDYIRQNGNLDILYSETLNDGRLPYYHRLDFSIKRTWTFKDKSHIQGSASVTNIYNRKNIFYFDRVRYERVNQLPVLPTVGVNYSF